MSVEKVFAFGNPNIGVYVVATDSFALIPQDAPEKVEEAARDAFKVDVFRVRISSSSLLGVFSAANSNGVLLGRFTTEEEVALIKKLLDVNVAVLDIRENAVGNLVLANDRVAVVSPLVPEDKLPVVGDVLGAEVVVKGLAGTQLVGSAAVATNRGVMVSPLASDEEVDELGEIFGIPVDVGTVNRGSLFVRAGMAANSRGALVGYETTGPELMRIHQILFG